MDTLASLMLHDEPQWLHPLQAGPFTVLSVARSGATLDAVESVLARLQQDPYVDFMRRWYALGRERFGHHWVYADQLTVLHAAARLLKPRRYLEIGVFRGRSLSVVADAAPDCELFGFDLWIPGYAGLDNVGPELVRAQLARVGHRAACQLESGNSHETVPRFLAAHPDLKFDLVTVDGDHTEEGARRDIEAVLPRIAVGGVLVFDDICHPKHPWLERVWDESVAALTSFTCAKFTEVGHGVALAVRRGAVDQVEARLAESSNAENRLAQLARALEDERARGAERVEVLEAEMERRLRLIEEQGAQLGRIPGLELELAQLREHVAFAETDRAKRLEVIEEQAARLGHLSGLSVELEQLREHVAFAEADRAKRLAVIEEQGARLGHLSGLESELEQLREHAAFAEADRAKRLAVIEEQGAQIDRLASEIAHLHRCVVTSESARITSESARLEREADLEKLQGAVQDLSARLTAAELDRSERLRIIEEQGARLGRIPALEADIAYLRGRIEAADAQRTLAVARCEQARHLVAQRVAGFLPPARRRALRVLLDELASGLAAFAAPMPVPDPPAR
jgi:predicted O-methyltransferase YrrM